jgi:hypothetical protein
MHRADGETAAQHRIGAGMAERDFIKGMRIAMRLQALDAPPQIRKHVRACAAHAPLLKNIGLPVALGMNPKLAHLFMICSNIKLTGPVESIELALQAIQQ